MIVAGAHPLMSLDNPESRTSPGCSPPEDVAASAMPFEALYREHAGRVYALCLRLSADSARAEHLTQDAFVRAWERLPSFRGESSFATWLRAIVVRVVLDDRRADGRRTRRVFANEELAEECAPTAPRGDDTAIDLERAMRTLPDGARTVFVLHEVEGYRHEEIAALCGIAEGTSKAQLFRARKLLKEMLR